MLYRVSGALFVPCTGLKRTHMVQPSTKSRASCTYLDIVQRAHKTVCFHQCDPISHFDLPVRLRVALQLTGTAIQPCVAAATPRRGSDDRLRARARGGGEARAEQTPHRQRPPAERRGRWRRRRWRNVVNSRVLIRCSREMKRSTP